MPAVYIVADPTSRRFKFGMTGRSDGSRVDGYRTALASYDRIEIQCSNASDVEAALKAVLAPHIVRHESGAASEVVEKGDGDSVLVKAFGIIMATRTPPRGRGGRPG